MRRGAGRGRREDHVVWPLMVSASAGARGSRCGARRRNRRRRSQARGRVVRAALADQVAMAIVFVGERGAGFVVLDDELRGVGFFQNRRQVASVIFAPAASAMRAASRPRSASRRSPSATDASAPTQCAALTARRDRREGRGRDRRRRECDVGNAGAEQAGGVEMPGAA